MGTQLVGIFDLTNGERVFVTSLERPIADEMLRQIAKLRSARILDAQGNQVLKTGMLAFGKEPNPDAADGTQCGYLVDVTRDS